MYPSGDMHFGYVPLAALLEEVLASWQGDIGAVRLLIDHGSRDNDGPVVLLCMRVSWTHVSGRHFDKWPCGRAQDRDMLVAYNSPCAPSDVQMFLAPPHCKSSPKRRPQAPLRKLSG